MSSAKSADELSACLPEPFMRKSATSAIRQVIRRPQETAQRRRRLQMPTPANPTIASTKVDGSGTTMAVMLKLAVD